MTRTYVNTLRALVRRFGNDTAGATAIEYALMASLIGATIASTVYTLGNSVTAAFYDRLVGMF
jgi:Flp pilus assembly pilin Flp